MTDAELSAIEYDLRALGEICAAVRERDMIIKTLGEAMMRAHEEIAAGKTGVASCRLALALSLVVPQ